MPTKTIPTNDGAIYVDRDHDELHLRVRSQFDDTWPDDAVAAIDTNDSRGAWLTAEHARHLATQLNQAAGHPSQGTVLAEVAMERTRQDDKWGEQNHPDGTGEPGSRHLADWARAVCKAKSPDTWLKILLEEVFEAGAESDPALLREELIQVAAVATQWVEAIDRRTAAACRPSIAEQAGRLRGTCTCGSRCNIPDTEAGRAMAEDWRTVHTIPDAAPRDGEVTR